MPRKVLYTKQDVATIVDQLSKDIDFIKSVGLISFTDMIKCLSISRTSLYRLVYMPDKIQHTPKILNTEDMKKIMFLASGIRLLNDNEYKFTRNTLQTMIDLLILLTEKDINMREILTSHYHDLICYNELNLNDEGKIDITK